MAKRDQPRGHEQTLSRFAGQPGRPVIVGGSPRSGTTLLRTMLNSHPELAMPRETRFVIEAWEARTRFGDLREAASRRRLAHWIFECEDSSRSSPARSFRAGRGSPGLARRFGLDRETAIGRLVAAPPTLGSVLATCFVLYAERHEKPRWGDKRPKYAAQMAAVWDLFPNAHFINVIRDPRSCVASMRRLGWYGHNIVPAVELWERSVKTVDSWRRRLAKDQLLDVRFEDLLADPADTLTELTSFAGLAADGGAVEQMLRYHERREVRSERYHANLSRPPDPSRVDAWRDELDVKEIAFVEDAAASLMRRQGYEPVADGVSPPAQLVRELRARRRRSAAGRWKLAWKDRVRKRVTHRHPLAAEVPAARPASASTPSPHRSPAEPTSRR
jgi:hypothetical protein